jgi:hypothetical protein
MADKKDETETPALAQELEKALTQAEAEEAEAQDALTTIADALVMIEKHLCAMVYLQKTLGGTEKTGLTYHDDVFNAIYSGEDPFSPENMPKPIPESAGENAPAA